MAHSRTLTSIDRPSPAHGVNHALDEVARIGKTTVELGQKIIGIIQAQSRHTKLLEKQAEQITDLQNDVRTLLAREDVLLARAGQTATQVAAATLSDLSRRVGRLEARGDTSED